MQKDDLKEKFKKTKISWQYVWDLINNLLEKNPDYHLKELLFMYQVELDSHMKKIEGVEKNIYDDSIHLTKEEKYSIDQLLSWIITDHQAKALFIDRFMQ